MFTREEVKLFYNILSNQSDYYGQWYKIKRKQNGRIKKRLITAPNEEYKELQKKITKEVTRNNTFKIHPLTYAWITGLNRETCASHHIDQKYLMEVDITDFFGNICDSHLYELFDRNGVTNVGGIPWKDMITFLTVPKKNKPEERHLPQGFNTSTYFANAVRYPIDCELEHICNLRGINFTSYGDNFFISGQSVPQSMKIEIKSILNKYRFDMNVGKTKIMPYYRRQVMLGITVNKKISIPKDYVSAVVKEVVESVQENTKMSLSLKGKINVLRLADNPRNFNFINRITKQES